MVALLETCSSTFLATTSLKFGALAFSSYVPAARSWMVYSPCPLVVVVRTAAVTTLRAVTVTFGIIAPLESATVPRIVPVYFCAKTDHVAKRRKNNSRTLNLCFLDFPHRIL